MARVHRRYHDIRLHGRRRDRQFRCRRFGKRQFEHAGGTSAAGLGQEGHAAGCGLLRVSQPDKAAEAVLAESPDREEWLLLLLLIVLLEVKEAGAGLREGGQVVQTLHPQRPAVQDLHLAGFGASFKALRSLEGLVDLEMWEGVRVLFFRFFFSRGAAEKLMQNHCVEVLQQTRVKWTHLLVSLRPHTHTDTVHKQTFT